MENFKEQIRISEEAMCLIMSKGPQAVWEPFSIERCKQAIVLLHAATRILLLDEKLNPGSVPLDILAASRIAIAEGYKALYGAGETQQIHRSSVEFLIGFPES